MNSKAYDNALALMRRKHAPSDEVYQLLVKAVNAGDYRAHYALGTWYLHGTHVSKNLKKAFRLLKKAAENDVADAAFDVAVCYEKGEGTNKDLSKAAAMYLRALRCGDGSAAKQLYRLFYWGIGVEKNRMLAREFSKFDLEM